MFRSQACRQSLRTQSDLCLVGNQSRFYVRCRFLGDFFVDLNDIFVAELLRESALHGTEFAGAAPDHRIAELEEQVFVNLQNGRLDRKTVAASRQEQWILKIRGFSSAFSIDTNKS